MKYLAAKYREEVRTQARDIETTAIQGLLTGTSEDEIVKTVRARKHQMAAAHYNFFRQLELQSSLLMRSGAKLDAHERSLNLDQAGALRRSSRERFVTALGKRALTDREEDILAMLGCLEIIAHDAGYLERRVSAIEPVPHGATIPAIFEETAEKMPIPSRLAALVHYLIPETDA